MPDLAGPLLLVRVITPAAVSGGIPEPWATDSSSGRSVCVFESSRQIGRRELRTEPLGPGFSAESSSAEID